MTGVIHVADRIDASVGGARERRGIARARHLGRDARFEAVDTKLGAVYHAEERESSAGAREHSEAREDAAARRRRSGDQQHLDAIVAVEEVLLAEETAGRSRRPAPAAGRRRSDRA